MKKDAYYFPHFCNAKHDRKLNRVKKDLGIEGYGIFFMLLETLREQPDFKYPLSDMDLLADEYGTSLTKLEAIVRGYNLFVIDSEDNFFSPKLILYLQPYIEKVERARVAANVRWNNVKQLNNANAYPNADTNAKQMECVSNARKGKERKVKERTLSQRNKFLDEGIEIKLATELYVDMKENNSNCKEPNIQKWASDVDLMLRIDKRNIEDIRKVINFSQHDNFWKSNILSTGKLRNKFDQLILKANSVVMAHEEHKSEKEIWT